MEISVREKLVLSAIINYYLMYGDTIGSRTLVKKFGITLSSATIRNVMADLEDMGLIEKTHTSSGRIPTDLGYKYYLNELLQVEKMTKEEKKNIDLTYENKVNELDNLLKSTSTLLSKLTNYTGIVLEPKTTTERMNRIELIHIDDYLIMAVLIMENRAIKTKKIHLVNSMSKSKLDLLSKELNHKIKNNEIAISEIESFIRGEEIIHNDDVNDDYNLSKFFIDNVSSIVRNKNSDEVTEIIDFFSDKNDIISLFEKIIKEIPYKPNKVNVIFGEDIGIKELENYSLVYSVYDIGGSKGVLGVIGPKRMAYSKTFGVLDQVTKEVKKIIDKMERKDETR